MGKCREDGGGGVDWPPGRPKPWSDLPGFTRFSCVRKQVFWGSLFSSWVRLEGLRLQGRNG
jgi:hypothetical protein